MTEYESLVVGAHWTDTPFDPGFVEWIAPGPGRAHLRGGVAPPPSNYNLGWLSYCMPEPDAAPRGPDVLVLWGRRRWSPTTVASSGRRALRAGSGYRAEVSQSQFPPPGHARAGDAGRLRGPGRAPHAAPFPVAALGAVGPAYLAGLSTVLVIGLTALTSGCPSGSSRSRSRPGCSRSAGSPSSAYGHHGLRGAKRGPGAPARAEDRDRRRGARRPGRRRRGPHLGMGPRSRP